MAGPKPHAFDEDGARRIVDMVRRMEALEINLKALQRFVMQRQAPILSTIAFPQELIEPGETGPVIFAQGLPGEEIEIPDGQEIEATNSSGNAVLPFCKCVLSWLMVEQSAGSGWHIVISDSPLMIGKTDAAHAADATGTISIWDKYSGSDTGINLEGVVNPFGDLEISKWVLVGCVDGEYTLVAGRCQSG